MLSLRLLERVRDVPREAWDLFAVPAASPFVEWTWLDCLEEAGCVGADAGWHPSTSRSTADQRPHRGRPGVREEEQRGGVRLRLELGRRRQPMGEFPITQARLSRSRSRRRPGTASSSRPGKTATRSYASWRRRSAAWATRRSLERPRPFPTRGESAQWRGRAPPSVSGSSTTGRNGATVRGFLARFNAKKRHQLRRESLSRPRAAIASRLSRLVTSTLRRRADDVRALRRERRQALLRAALPEPAVLRARRRRASRRLAWVVAKKEGELVAGAFNVKRTIASTAATGAVLVADEPFLHFNVCYYHGVRECIAEGRASRSSPAPEASTRRRAASSRR